MAAARGGGIMKLRQLLKELGALRFTRVSQTGSHVKMQHPNGRSVMIYAHRRDEEISPVSTKAILRDAQERAAACETHATSCNIEPR